MELDAVLSPTGEVIVLDGETEILRLTQDQAQRLRHLIGALANEPGWTGVLGTGRGPR